MDIIWTTLENIWATLENIWATLENIWVTFLILHLVTLLVGKLFTPSLLNEAKYTHKSLATW